MGLFVSQAILSRKLVVPEMEDVMKKVAKFAIDGSNDQVRTRCRQVSQVTRHHLCLCSSELSSDSYLSSAVTAALSEVPDGLSTGQETEETFRLHRCSAYVSLDY